MPRTTWATTSPPCSASLSGSPCTGARPPRTLVLDQPPQVYFPQEPTGEEVLQTNDRTQLLNTYEAIHRTLQQLEGKMQVIVMEHADLDDPVFSQHVVERWRYVNDSGLVPSACMETAPREN